MIQAPLISTRPENTLPYKDWLRTCGIDGVYDEDHTMRIWESWIRRCSRFGRRTHDRDLYRAFAQQSYLKQLDIAESSGRSSDVNLQVMFYTQRHIHKTASNITVSEHAVRRWWQHTGRRPDIMSWIEAWPDWSTWEEYCTGGQPTGELYHPDALLLGTIFRTDNATESINIDTRHVIRHPGLAFRVATVVPVDQLNEGQTYRWYQLKEQIENRNEKE